MDEGERRAAVAIVVRRLGDDAEIEGAASLGRSSRPKSWLGALRILL
jgi:hypothetical protein